LEKPPNHSYSTTTIVGAQHARKKKLGIPYVDGFAKAKQFIIPESQKRIEFADVLISV